LEWLVDSPFIAFSLSIFYFGNMSFFFSRFICHFTPALSHEKKGETPPFFTFNFFGFLLSINSLA